LQLPLPKSINEKLVCSSISSTKDVDGFRAVNMGQLALNRPALYPCTPLGVMEMIKRSNIPTEGKNAVVIGRSKNVGLPIALLLHSHPYSKYTRTEIKTGSMQTGKNIYYKLKKTKKN